MANVFISYRTTFPRTARELHTRLITQGYSDVFLDAIPETGLVAGHPWASQLEDAVKASGVIILLVSAGWLTSEYCQKEYQWARQAQRLRTGAGYRRPAIFPIFLSETVRDGDANFVDGPINLDALRQTYPDLADIQGIKLDIGFEARPKKIVDHKLRAAQRRQMDEIWRRLERALAEYAVAPNRPYYDRTRPPYPGLAALQEEDAAVFFGRESVVDEAMEKLEHMRTTRAARLMAILGASGAGKSSVLRAGVLYHLKYHCKHQYYCLPTLRPGDKPITGQTGGLIQALDKAFEPSAIYTEQEYPDRQPRKLGDIRRIVEKGTYAVERCLLELQQQVARRGHDGDKATPITLVLPVDQGEELFPSAGDLSNAANRQRYEEAKVLRTMLAEILRRQNVDLIVVTAIRSDSFHQMQHDPDLGELPIETINLAPLASGLYSAVIEGPALVAKASVDPALTDAILDDVEGVGDALPLMAFVLRRIWNELSQRPEGDKRKLLLADYEKLDRIGGAIERVAREALPSGFDEKLLKSAFVPHLATVSELSGAFLRRIANEGSELPAAAGPLIDRLVDARLLVRHDDQIEVAHEAVLRQWPLLAGWLEKAKNALGILNTTENDCELWRRERELEPSLKRDLLIDQRRLYQQERLELVYGALEDLGLPRQRIDRIGAFIRPELERLIEELRAADGDELLVDHPRRLAIGNRLDDLYDQRPGVGVFFDETIARELARLRRHRELGFAVDQHRIVQLERILAERGVDDFMAFQGLPDIAWCAVPAGEVDLRLKTDGAGKPTDDVTRRTVATPFWVARYPLTIAQFFAFGYPFDSATGRFDKNDRLDQYSDERWWSGFPEDSRESMQMTLRDGTRARRNYAMANASPIQEQDPQANFPAQFVNWFQAIAFARWLTDRYRALGLIDEDQSIRLPTEWEWQQAATGGRPGRLYPWGNTWNAGYCRNKDGQNSPSSVGLHPHGNAPTGACDMSGLIVEWCLNTYHDIDDVNETTDALRPTRGGAYFTFARPELPDYEPQWANSVHGRLSDHPSGTNDDQRTIRTGVRLICTGLSEKARGLVTWEDRFGA